MKIAFVGKGGSGKTTISALYALYASQTIPVTIIDADINVHIPQLFGMKPAGKSLSDNENALAIKKVLRGSNSLIEDVSLMKKSTPPAKGSGIVDFDTPGTCILNDYLESVEKDLFVASVGTYETKGIGVSCYHNNLSILENILSHSRSSKSCVVVDMVAGTDAFASTLHAQFDLIVLVVEPTQKSVDVYQSFITLAKEAGITAQVAYVINKVEDESDISYVLESVGRDGYIGSFSKSAHIKNVDRGTERISINKLSDSDQDTLQLISTKISESVIDPNDRLKKLWDLHHKYVSQDYVINRHGDLRGQVDRTFRL